MQQPRKIITIGEPRIDVLPEETADFFYTTILSRITDLIREDHKSEENPSERCDSEGDKL